MKDFAVSSSALLPLDDRRNRKSTSPAGLTPMKNDVGSAKVDATGNVDEKIGCRFSRVDAISNREGKDFGKSEATGRDRIGISVSAEKIDGMPFCGESEASEGFNSGVRLEKEGL